MWKTRTRVRPTRVIYVSVGDRPAKRASRRGFSSKSVRTNRPAHPGPTCNRMCNFEAEISYRTNVQGRYKVHIYIYTYMLLNTEKTKRVRRTVRGENEPERKIVWRPRVRRTRVHALSLSDFSPRWDLYWKIRQSIRLKDIIEKYGTQWVKPRKRTFRFPPPWPRVPGKREKS